MTRATVKVDNFLHTVFNSDNAWPTHREWAQSISDEDIRELEAADDATEDGRGHWSLGSLRYVPRALRKRVVMIAHTAGTGHRGHRATAKSLSKFGWKGKHADIKQWVHECVHCRRADPAAEPKQYEAHTPPRAIGHRWGTDVLDMGIHQREGEPRYVIVFVEEVTGFVVAEPAADTSSGMAVEALSRVMATHAARP